MRTTLTGAFLSVFAAAMPPNPPPTITTWGVLPVRIIVLVSPTSIVLSITISFLCRALGLAYSKISQKPLLWELFTVAYVEGKRFGVAPGIKRPDAS
jgi:hypothetical protein